MGDEIPQRQQLPLGEYTGNFQRDPSPHGPPMPMIAQPIHPQNANFGPYRQQQSRIEGYRGGGAYDMASMGNALPDATARQYQQQFGPSQNIQHYMYQQPPGIQFAGQTPGVYNQLYSQQYQFQNPPNIALAHSTSRHTPYTSNPQLITTQSAMQGHNMATQQPFALHVHPALQSQQSSYLGFPHSGQYTASYNTRPGGSMDYSSLQPDSIYSATSGTFPHRSAHPGIVRRTSSNSSLQASLLRGPPRKPKQSGYALWVGNLPPGTHIIDLKDHFAKDAMTDIESVFLISKSNCAFVNYKTEPSCAAAMARFHDSRFHGVRLVCRLRKGNASHSGRSPTATVPGESSEEEAAPVEEKSEVPAVSESTERKETERPVDKFVEKVAEKYFVVKSLTLEDMERSVLNGIWATQSHNEATFNKAYHTADNVYLIFSANKSGEYFGYARMTSPIDDEAAANLEYPTRPVAPEPHPADLPLTIPTPATSTAPKGRIIDDSTRGTIFWEADIEEKEDEQGHTSGEGEGEDAAADAGTGGVIDADVNSSTAQQPPSMTFGKPFRVVWMSTERLPFYRTRGLRNPWNSNREVKIARDGTEIEPSVGRRLTAMFHRPAPQPGPISSGMNPMMYAQMPHGWQQQQQPQPPYTTHQR